MHTFAIVACLAAALRPILAATSNFPPQFFFLQAQMQPGQSSSKSSFNNLYLNPTTQSSTLAVPALTKLSAYARVLTASQTAEASGSAPALYDVAYNESTSDAFLLTLQYNLAPFAAWAPANFLHNGTLAPTSQQNQFVFNGTEEHATLIASANSAFTGWIACDWWYGEPQLFVAVELGVKKTLPSSCAVIDLKVIPIPNAN